MFVPTCSEVDDEVKKKYCVGDAVEDNPFGTEIIIEEGNSDR